MDVDAAWLRHKYPITSQPPAEKLKTCPVPGHRGCSLRHDGTCPAIGCPAPKPPAGGDAETKGWDHRYRPLIWGEVIQPTDECRRDDGTWVTGICVGEKAPDPSYTSHRIYRRLRLYDVVQEALEFACLTLAFHGRDRGTPRQEKMLDDLEVLARRLDTACRTVTKPKPGGAAEWQDRLDWDHEARRDQEIYEQLSGKD